MPLFQLISNRHYQLGIWKITESADDLCKLCGTNPPGELRNAERQQEYLAVRSLCLSMGLCPEKIRYEKNGKPFYAEENTYISISHTKKYASLVVSPHRLIGVDIEHFSNRVHRIRERFMHPEEETRLAGATIQNSTEETTGLLVHWCAKESLFKSVPDAGIDFKEELRIESALTNWQNGQLKGIFMRNKTHFDIDYLVNSEFVLTCSFSEESR